VRKFSRYEARHSTEILPNTQNTKSKGTHGQTRGLSNLEMKHVGKLATIGQFWAHTVQSLARLLFQYGDGFGLRG